MFDLTKIENTCLDKSRYFYGFIAAIIPFSFRLIQCTVVVLNSTNNKFNQNILNFIKYVISIMVAVLSFLS